MLFKKLIKVNKKIVIIYFFIIIIILNLLGFKVKADDFEEDIDDNDEILNENIIETLSNSADEPNINSKSAVIYDRKTKKVLWGKDENLKRAMASTTKIMTAIIVLEKSNLEDIVSVSKKAASIGGSRLKLNYGDKIKVKDLLYGLMLRSGNDAAIALAEYVGGSVKDFVFLMNKKAKDLGLNNTNFVTPHGLDDINHFTTAYELAKLTDYALSNEMFEKIVGTKETVISINNTLRNIHNTNELLGNLQGVNGVKTGFTNNAGRCLVTSCTRNDNQIITVVLGADTKKQRTKDSITLIEYAFNNFERVNIKEKIESEFENWKKINLKRIYINKAENKDIIVKLGTIKNSEILIKKSDIKDIKIEVNAIYNYEAPLEKNYKIGSLIVKNNDEIIEIVDILNDKEVKKKNILDYIKNMLFEIISGEILKNYF